MPSNYTNRDFRGRFIRQWNSGKPPVRPLSYRRRLAMTRNRGAMPLYRGVSLPGVYNFTRKTDQYFDFSNNAYNNAEITCPPNDSKILLMGFAFECLPNDTEFSAIFKYYKIKAVKVTLVFGVSTTDTANGSKANMPDLLTCWAPDDNALTMPITLQRMRERQNCKLRFPNATQRAYSFYLKNPRVADEIGDMAGSGNVLVGSTYKGWLPLVNRSIVHNGFIVGLDNNNNDNDIVVKTEFKYYFKCRQVV